MGQTLFCMVTLLLLKTIFSCGHAQDAELTHEPNSTILFHGESVTFTCNMKEGRHSNWYYKFHRNGHQIVSNQDMSNFLQLHLTTDLSGNYQCTGYHKDSPSFIKQSNNITLFVSAGQPVPVLTVSPSWLNPGASVTLKCEVQPPSTGWRFYWYKAVPDLSHEYDFAGDLPIGFYPSEAYHFELLPDSINGTVQDFYIIHGQKHTVGYACRAGRGNPEYFMDYSEPNFVWSADSYPAASLTVSPDRGQHFTSEFVTLSCGGNSTQWRVRTFSQDKYFTFPYWQTWDEINASTKRIRARWTCSAVYWCESESGEFSNAINITIYDDDLILVNPVHPVGEGASVTLGCKLRTGNFTSSVAFYKNDKLIQNTVRGEVNIPAVSASDEGLYKCEHSGKVSLQSWMAVKSSSASLPVLMIVGLVVGFSLAVLILLLLFATSLNRLIQCHRTNQNSAAALTHNQEETQKQIYSSLLHGDAAIYETIRSPENPVNDQ